MAVHSAMLVWHTFSLCATAHLGGAERLGNSKLAQGESGATSVRLEMTDDMAYSEKVLAALALFVHT